jgi:hypothetical protein
VNLKHNDRLWLWLADGLLVAACFVHGPEFDELPAALLPRGDAVRPGQASHDWQGAGNSALLKTTLHSKMNWRMLS